MYYYEIYTMQIVVLIFVIALIALNIIHLYRAGHKIRDIDDRVSRIYGGSRWHI